MLSGELAARPHPQPLAHTATESLESHLDADFQGLLSTLIHGINFNNKNLAGTASLPSKSSQWQNQESPGRGLEGRLSAHLLPLSPRCKGTL